MKALTLAILLVGPVLADDLYLKNGSRITWKSITDKGDSYEILNDKGVKTNVKKEDIDHFGPPVVHVMPKARPVGRVKGTVDIVSAIDPDRDVATGPEAKVRRQNGVLVADLRFDQPSKIKIPVKVTEEYGLSMIVERRAGTSDWFVILPSNGQHVLVRFDADQGTKSGMNGGLKENEDSRPVFPLKKPVLVTITVRPSGEIHVVANGKKLFDLDPAGEPVATPDPYIVFGSQKIFGTPENLWVISRAILTIKNPMELEEVKPGGTK